MGRDTDETVKFIAQWVSTHAPAWGATTLRIEYVIISFMFQPTRPHGARQFVRRIKVLQESFNPRARMGRDLYQQA